MIKSFLSFDTFLVPKLSKVIYWIGLVLIVLGFVAGLISALAASSSPYTGGAGAGFAIFISTTLGTVAALIIWRVAVELWLVLFSIYDVLKDIRDQRR